MQYSFWYGLIIVFQVHAIITGSCLFLIMREAAGISLVGRFFVPVVILDLTCSRHEEDVAIIQYAGSAEVPVAEAIYHTVGIVVA